MEQNPEAKYLDSRESLNLYGSSKVESLKKMVKFVASICVLSLFLVIFSHFPHNSLITFNHGNMERKYMFLICNGILFLLANCSVIEDSSSFEPFDYSFSNSYDEQTHDLVAAIEEQNDQEMETKEEEEKVEEIINGVGLFEEEDEGCFTEEEEDEEEEKGRELEMVVSTEELNKKIEEFIRKMKEEMRIEAAQTQLVVV